MGDEDGKKADGRFDFIKDRISSAFPKLAGPKLDKVLVADEIRLNSYILCSHFDSNNSTHI